LQEAIPTTTLTPRSDYVARRLQSMNVRTAIRKLEAHADHLLGYSFGLRRTFELLKPIATKGPTRSRRAQAIAAMHALCGILYRTCVQEVVVLAFDADGRSVSASKLIDALEKPIIVATLRKQRVRWEMPTDVDLAQDDRQAVKAYEEDRQRELGEEFDAELAKLKADWAAFKSLDSVASFQVVRDKMAAHIELRLRDGTYEPVTLDEPISIDDLSQVLERFEDIVASLNQIIRGAGYSKTRAREQFERLAKRFWDA
jgi:hypothetical protein